MIKSKILNVTLYQAVKLDNNSHKYFVPDKVTSTGIQKGVPGFTITRTEYGITVESETELIEIFYPNIACITYEKIKEEPKTLESAVKKAAKA